MLAVKNFLARIGLGHAPAPTTWIPTSFDSESHLLRWVGTHYGIAESKCLKVRIDGELREGKIPNVNGMLDELRTRQVPPPHRALGKGARFSSALQRFRFAI